MPKPPDLDAAYALETPEDNRALYADWAETYDSSFADAMDYRLPQHVARIFLSEGAVTGPVLDVGAGTGLVGQYILAARGCVIDGLDISPDMLRVAGAKGIYRRMLQVDLTGPVAIADHSYGAVVSSGTFTHGHVGPDALDPLLRVARPGALFVLSVNAEHFAARGFEAKFAALEAQITGFRLETVPIYGPGADPAHAQDTGHIAVFRRR